MLSTTKNEILEKGLPFLLTALIIAVDRLTKLYIVQNYPVPDGSVIKDVFNNGLIWIIHVRNDVIAFSLGRGLPEFIRPALFIALPVLVLGLLMVYYFVSNEWRPVQRWALAGILGGGVGNLIDRIWAPGGVKGVVDFISVKFYGIFGFERWPTFNVADASVVICVFLWLGSIIFDFKKPDGKNLVGEKPDAQRLKDGKKERKR